MTSCAHAVITAPKFPAIPRDSAVPVDTESAHPAPPAQDGLGV